MTMVSSGPISLGGTATTGGLNQSINVELGLSGTTTISLNQANVRTLLGVPSGAISLSNAYGKSNRVALSYTYGATTSNASLNITSLSGYSAGKTDVTITVNAGVYIYSTSTGNAGLALSGGSTGDTVTLVNNGFIMGMGGTGGNPYDGAAGGPAISLGFNTTINNTNGSAYIGGGGGGGGRMGDGGGGGGAGGGNGSGSNAGSGGGPGSSGSNSYITVTYGTYGAYYNMGGGGGGRIFPGSGGAGGSPPVPSQGYGRGGGAGGGGSTPDYRVSGGAGGSANNNGGNGGTSFPAFSNGGGGGWGASGGQAATAPYANVGYGGGGGRAVQLNGRTVTWVSGDTTRVWGAVS